jgi:hypothetical protein
MHVYLLLIDWNHVDSHASTKRTDKSNGEINVIASVRTPGQIASQKRAAASLKKNGKRHAATALGVVEAGKSYSIPAFIQTMGITRSALSAMRRRGLIARKNGEGRVEILGSDYHEYLKSQPIAELA